MIKGILTAKDTVKHNICASYSYMCQDYHGGWQLGYTVSSSLHECHWDFVAMPCMYVKFVYSEHIACQLGNACFGAIVNMKFATSTQYTTIIILFSTEFILVQLPTNTDVFRDYNY